jgi:hypothetical protein
MRQSGFPVFRYCGIDPHQGHGPADRYPASPCSRTAVAMERSFTGIPQQRCHPLLSIKRTATRFSGIAGRPDRGVDPHQGHGPADRSPASPSSRMAVVQRGGCPGIQQQRCHPLLSIKRTATRFSSVTGIRQYGRSAKPANRHRVVRHAGVGIKLDGWHPVGRRRVYGPTFVRSDRKAALRFFS